MLFLPWLLLAQLSIASIITPKALTQSELEVNTSSGVVRGFYNTSSHAVRAFLGIPYAEPPTGSLRFAPPVPKSPSRDIIDATAYPRPCPGGYAYDSESIWSVLPYNPWNIDEMTEDCLSINVWAPAKKHKGSRRHSRGAAVMLYIHGGGFFQGGTAITFYDGNNLVEDNEDIIVVTFAYRLSVFGFPNAPGLPLDQQNVGLLDQRLAVEWVHRNIAQFGGDPSRILLFGQSAGAASVDAYAYTYPENPLVHALAMQSGAASMITTDDTTHGMFKNLSRALGCGSGLDSVECMRKKTTDEIMNAMALLPSSYLFFPLQENHTIFADYPARAKQGKLARLPTIIGTAEREWSASFNLSAPSIDPEALFAGTQATFVCPVHQSSLLRVSQHVPTWRYLYHGNFTNLSPVPWLGAYHSSDIPIVFGTYNLTNIPIPSSPQEVQASHYIQGAWVSFARDPRNGLRKYGWPQFDPAENTLVHLALNNSVPAVFGSSTTLDSHCEGDVFIP